MNRKQRDVATTATSTDAIPGLQPVVARAIAERAAAAPQGGVSVGLIGPGKKQQENDFSPQVRETLNTMLNREGSGTDQLHIYNYNPGYIGPALRVTSEKNKTTGRTVEITEHPHFDVTKPVKPDEVKHDVLIATRVMAPVVRALPRGPKRERKEAVSALRNKAKDNAHLIVDRGAKQVLQDHGPKHFGNENAKTQGFGRRPRDPFSFSFGQANSEALQDRQGRPFNSGNTFSPVASAQSKNNQPFKPLDDQQSKTRRQVVTKPPVERTPAQEALARRNECGNRFSRNNFKKK